MIPEEGSVTDSPAREEAEFLRPPGGGGAVRPALAPSGLTGSELSEASVFGSGSEAGPSRSGATTPVTSEDGGVGGRGSAQQQPLSAVQAGKLKAIEVEVDGLGLIHPNGSHATVRRDFDEEHTPRGPDYGARNGALRGRKAMVPGELDVTDSPTFLAVQSPPLTRHFSTSSTASFTSTSGSPVPAHAKTPSRTKRRSVGSTFSERLFSLDEEAFAGVRVDYLAMLNSPEPAPLSTPAEQSLLDSLTTLGFDTGQIVHSVTTDACDASAAIWFLLKRKADEQRREQDAEGSVRSFAHSAATSRANSIKRTPEVVRASSGSAVARVPEEDLPGGVGGFLSEDEEEDGALLTSRPRMTEATARPRTEDEEKLGYFLHGMTTSKSAPMLSYFPPVGPGSPSKLAGGSSPQPVSDGVQPARTPPVPMSTPPLQQGPTSPLAGDSAVADSPGSPGGDFRKQRARASSIGMLARATSAMGLKKVADGIREDAKQLVAEEGGRSTPPVTSGGQGKGLFHRKGSLPTDSLAPAGQGSPKKATPELPTIGLGSPPKSLSALPPQVLVELNRSPAKGTVTRSDSHETFDTISSVATASSSNRRAGGGSTGAGHRKSKGAAFFTSFKLWFADDRHKRKGNGAGAGKRGSLHGAMVPQPGQAGGVEGAEAGPVLGRSNSAQRRTIRQEGTGVYRASPLTRPPMGSRRSSAGSMNRPISRRSSISSSHRVKLDGGAGYGALASPHPALQRRRMSESSRHSTSDREPSRPPSIRSFSGQDVRRQAAGQRHSHTPSVGSVSSPHVSKDAVYRHPPMTTTVRRRHGSQSRHGSHSRNRSTSSSIKGGRPSSQSSFEGELESDAGGEGGEKAVTILEEDEGEGTPGLGFVSEPEEVGGALTGAVGAAEDEGTMRAKARQDALRQLSGGEPKASTTIGDTSARTEGASASRASSRDRDSASIGGHSHSHRRHRSGSGSYARDAVFLAHKSHHVFGSPSQPIPAPTSGSGSASSDALPTRRRSGLSRASLQARQPLRDVFARPTSPEGVVGGVDEWVDDEEELGGYGGGLGQGSLKQAHARGASVSSLATITASMYPGAGGSVGGGTAQVQAEAAEAVQGKQQAVAGSMFAGRYAGVGGWGAAGGAGGKAGGAEAAAGLKEGAGGGEEGQTGTVGRRRGPQVHAATVIEEEEEEE